MLGDGSAVSVSLGAASVRREEGEGESAVAGSVSSWPTRWRFAIWARRRRCSLRARQRRKPQSPLLRRNASVKSRRAQICIPCMGHLLALYTIAIEPIAAPADEDEYAIEHQECAYCARRRIARVGCGRCGWGTWSRSRRGDRQRPGAFHEHKRLCSSRV